MKIPACQVAICELRRHRVTAASNPPREAEVDDECDVDELSSISAALFELGARAPPRSVLADAGKAIDKIWNTENRDFKWWAMLGPRGYLLSFLLSLLFQLFGNHHYPFPDQMAVQNKFLHQYLALATKAKTPLSFQTVVHWLPPRGNHAK